MKLEVQKNSSLPRYAAALMCLTAVPMLTGCREVLTTEGQTVAAVEPELELAGAEQVYSEPELDFDGEESVYSEPELELGGDMPAYSEPEPVMTAIPQEELTPERFAWFSEHAFNEACAALGQKCALYAAKQFDYADCVFDEALSITCGGQTYSVCYYIGTEQTVFERECEVIEGTFTEMFESQETAQKFDWGFVDDAKIYKRTSTIIDEYSRVIFIDCAGGMPLTAEDAAQILNDLLTAYAGEEVHHETTAAE